MRLGETGFLAGPTGEYGNILNRDSVPFDRSGSVRCLVLLGGPGMGKSHEMERIFPAVEAAARSRLDGAWSAT